LAWLLVSFTAMAATKDWSARRIPNLLPLALLAGGGCALILRIWSGEPAAASLASAAAGAGLGVLVTMPGYLLGVMAAGDVKLLAATGWALAWPSALVLIVIWALAFASWCLVAAVSGGKRRQPVAPSILVGHASAVALGFQ